MDIGARMQYLKSIYQRYQRSTRREKREILNEFSKVCKYNRKYAIRILNGPAPDTRKNKPKREREKIYGHRVISILEAIWSVKSNFFWKKISFVRYPFRFLLIFSKNQFLMN